MRDMWVRVKRHRSQGGVWTIEVLVGEFGFSSPDSLQLPRNEAERVGSHIAREIGAALQLEE